ncbi:hypothetical protein [Roseibium sp.]|uniref:hypothetical protein n=1 Tax=Roseibium sp. TaxID=1936156 RepID=UPI0039F08621
MKFVRVIAAFLLALSTGLPAHAVVVDINQVSEGEPTPGTTLSLETLDGEEIELEIDLADLDDVLETDLPDIAEGLAQPASTGQPAEAPATVTSETTPAPGERPKRRVAAVPVPKDGNIRFEVDDKYRDKPVILVLKDRNGRVIERRSLTLTGALVSVTASSLPAIGTPGAPAPVTFAQTGAQPQNIRPVSTDTGQSPNDVVKERFQLSVEFEAGWMERDSFNALRLQNGGNVVQDRFASVDRDGQFTSVMIQGQADLGTSAPLFGTNLYALGSFRYGYSGADSYKTNVSSGGEDLAILALEGPGGVLGGGAVVAAPNSDLDYVAYNDNYHEYMAQLGLMTMVTSGPVTFSPRALFFYGQTNESLNYRGRTNGNTLFFGYEIDTNSHRVGVQLGSELAYQLADGFSVFAGADARLVQNFSETDGSLTFSGEFAHNETVKTDKNLFDVGGILEGGVRFQRGRFSANVGGRFETWRIPVTQVTGERPLYIDYQSRNSYSAFARFNIALGGPAN